MPPEQPEQQSEAKEVDSHGTSVLLFQQANTVQQITADMARLLIEDEPVGAGKVLEAGSLLAQTLRFYARS